MGATLSDRAADGTGPFPSSGKLMSITASCSHNGEVVHFSSYRGQAVTSDWTSDHLEEALQTLARVHRLSQRLMFGGSIADRGDTIQSMLGVAAENVPDRLKLFLLVDRTTFPEKLGPFASVPVAVESRDIAMPEITEEVHQNGGCWEMSSSGLQRAGLHVKSPLVIGQISPISAITFERECERRSLCIPPTAASFAWSYAVDCWDSVERDAYLLETWDDPVDNAACLQSFLSVGGFVFFDAHGTFVGATTVGRRLEGEQGNLHFAEARRWAPEWTRALVEQGRFHAITIKAVRDFGVRMYLWLRPCEIIEGADGNPLPDQPDVPHGGFVYLFHEDVLSAAPEDVALDRYFPVAASLPSHLDAKQVATPSRERQQAASPVFRSFTLEDGRPGSSHDAVVVQTVESSSARTFPVWREESGSSAGSPTSSLKGRMHF